jgi:glycosyltransferase involved in cell wall biosynthesis
MLTLATNLRDQGCLVSIIVFNNVRELESDFDNIYHFNRYFRWIPRKLRGYCLAPILDHFIVSNCGAPDLVLSNLLIVDRLVAHSRFNKHIIIHNTISAELKYLSVSFDEYKRVYEGQSLVCVSKGVMNDLSEVLTQQPAEKLNYIYNPVDQAYIEKAANADVEVPRGEYIIHVGSFSASKRHDLLIRAYASSGIEEKLVLVGKGKLENELKELVSELGVEDKVLFLGFRANPYPLIKKAKLLVLSSDYEGLPTVILEALSLGVPVVSTNCKSGPSEMLPPANLCVVGDLNGLAELMQTALITPAKYIVPLAQQFTPEYTSRQYLNLIRPLDEAVV